ncbi:helix-turn-helix domain-containing protein [uncultured Kriegella sp.]|uniref:helix-turn-helix domain-containing protein n=1 Tax=uncultured Kriegella sp. TaxID=1798910 RepID=UPI0030DCB864
MIPFQATSIAVLPFENIGADENEYFADGITEEIINALTKITGLKVTARTSSFFYRKKHLDARIIGNALGVETLLEGSVRMVKERVRISAQLVRTDNGFHIWAENFDRNLADIFELQDEISLLIADNLRENFGHLEVGEQLIQGPEISVDQYQIYLKAKHYLHKFNTENIKLAIDMLKGVVQQQPDFALAHVNIHYGYNMMAAGGLMPVKEALTLGKAYLDKALELDNNLPEAYHSLGWHSLNLDWDFKNAAKFLRKAIALRPGYADAHHKLFITHALEGKFELAHKHIETAYQLDPLAPLNNYFYGYYHYLLEEFEASNRFMEKTFELDPSFMVGYSIYALSLIKQNRAEYILQKAETIPNVEGGDVERLIMRALAFSSLGIENGEIDRLNVLLDSVHRERICFFLIYIKTNLKDFDAALDLIDKGVARREPLMTLLQVDPLLRPLHSHERFQKAIKQIFAFSDLQTVEAPEKDCSSLLDDDESKQFLTVLKSHMVENEPFLRPTISLRDLAVEVDIHPNKLSWLLNEKIGKNFNDFVNAYRLEHFKKISLMPENKAITLLGLAYDSGFNSKTVFNTFFKRETRMTPKQWVKTNMRKSIS